jgi:hypothetical protein
MKKMKLLFSVLVLCALSNISHAQYQSMFGENQTSWNILHEQLFGDYVDSLSVIADTTINDSIWKKLSYYTTFNTQPEQMNVFGYVKEDTTSGKAWYFSTADFTKRLIMDLSLTLTDSFQLINIGGSAYYQVDSIYYVSTKKYIRLNFPLFYSANQEKFTMIEGTGTNIGIRYTESAWPGLNPYLLCQQKDFLPEYLNVSPDWMGACSITTSNPNEITDFKFSFYPNPAQNEIRIESDEGLHSFNVEILDLTGKILLNILSYEKNKRSIDVSQLNEGMYILRIFSNEFRFNKPFIKTNQP